MTKREARRLALEATAAFIDVNLGNGEGDLWVGFDQLPEADIVKVSDAIAIISDQLWEKARKLDR